MKVTVFMSERKSTFALITLELSFRLSLSLLCEFFDIRVIEIIGNYEPYFVYVLKYS